MSKLIEKWKAAEPVRLYLYAVLVPVVASLVAFGAIDQEAAGYVLAGLAAVLGVAGIESARSSVVAPLTLALPSGQPAVQAAVDSVPGRVVQAALVREYAGRHRQPEVEA